MGIAAQADSPAGQPVDPVARVGRVANYLHARLSRRKVYPVVVAADAQSLAELGRATAEISGAAR